MKSLSSAGGGFWGAVEQDEVGKPDGESCNQSQLEPHLSPAGVEETSSQAPRCASWKAHKLTSWEAHMLTNWQADKFTIYRLADDKMTRGQDDKMTRWQDDKMTRWQDDKMTRWQNDKMTRWQDDMMKWWSDEVILDPWSWSNVFCLMYINAQIRNSAHPLN